MWAGTKENGQGTPSTYTVQFDFRCPACGSADLVNGVPGHREGCPVGKRENAPVAGERGERR